jgi:protein dithiol oxidoreductase (disulfide-forming)
MTTTMYRTLIRAATYALAMVLFASARVGYCEDPWTVDVNYFLILPAQPTGLADGKIEVTEIFSYACPGCNRFYPIADKLAASLPSNTVMDFLPASFQPDEDWPMFQRAYFAALELGVARRTHDAMFDAIWKSGELAVYDANTKRAKRPPPSLADAAKFYERVAGIKSETFMATAASFGTDVKVRHADELIAAYGVAETPTIIVNGKYRLNPITAGGDLETIDLVKWLVARESAVKPVTAH